MVYLQKVCTFLVVHDVIFLSVTFCGVWLFGTINWLRDGYRKQNGKLTECCRKATTNPRFKSIYLAKLPNEYLRQWRAYVNSGATRPSLTFEFVPHKKKLIGLPIFVVSAVASTVYLVVFFVALQFREYAVFQVAFWLSFVVVLLTNDVLFKKKERRARRIFGRFVATLNALEENPCSEGPVQSFCNTKKNNATDDALEKISALLRQNGLDACRTTGQQQKINRALNGLLQAYSKEACRNK